MEEMGSLLREGRTPSVEESVLSEETFYVPASLELLKGSVLENLL
jgi:hypothetical protein